MQKHISRSQSASLTLGFNSEEEADKWIEENKQSDSIYKITDHVTYTKTGSEEEWFVKRNYYYEVDNGTISTREETDGVIPNKSTG